MSYGPNDTKVPNSKLGFATYFRKSTSDYTVYPTLPVEVNVNRHIFTLTRGLGKILPFQGMTTNCVNMASLSLWLNGIPNIGLHPYLLYATTWAYSVGIRKADGQLLQKQIIDDDIYIYEFAIKKPGRANLGFIIVESNFYQDISFDVHFSKGKINKVNRTISPIYSDNNIADRLGNFYYSSDDFVKKCRLIPDNIYKMISPSFLEMTNKERLKILNELWRSRGCTYALPRLCIPLISLSVLYLDPYGSVGILLRRFSSGFCQPR